MSRRRFQLRDARRPSLASQLGPSISPGMQLTMGEGSAVPIEDLGRAIRTADSGIWHSAAELARRLDALDVFTAGLHLRPEGAAWAEELGLPRRASRRSRVTSQRPAPRGSGFEQLASAKGTSQDRDPRAQARAASRICPSLGPAGGTEPLRVDQGLPTATAVVATPCAAWITGLVANSSSRLSLVPELAAGTWCRRSCRECSCLDWLCQEWLRRARSCRSSGPMSSSGPTRRQARTRA